MGNMKSMSVDLACEFALASIKLSKSKHSGFSVISIPIDIGVHFDSPATPQPRKITVTYPAELFDP